MCNCGEKPRSTYSVIDKESGRQVASFWSAESAFEWLKRNATPDDEWALLRFNRTEATTLWSTKGGTA
jgi:hypothetical protein